MLTIEEKARIISQAPQAFLDLPILEDFFKYNDVGIPLSQALNYGLCTLLEEGEEAIEETWEYLCVLGNKDPNLDTYENIDDILDLEDDE